MKQTNPTQAISFSWHHTRALLVLVAGSLLWLIALNFIAPLALKTGVVAWILFWSLVFVTSRPTFFKRCVGLATPGFLGAIRMLVCAILLLNVLSERFSSIAFLPPQMRQSMGLMRLFYALPIGFDRFVTSESALGFFQVGTAVILFLGMIGLGTRVVIPMGAFTFFIFTGLLRQYTFFWHQHLVPLYVMAVLVVTPCGDGWSLDRLVRLARGKVTPEDDCPTALYGWARYACWVVVALPYVAAGLSKLRNVGPAWWDAGRMRWILYIDSLNPMQFDWRLSLILSHAPDAFFVFLALAGMWGEILYGFVLVSCLARRFFPALMAFMHVGILFLQNILFIDLILLQLIFYDFGEWRRAAGQWLVRRRGKVEILYDGWCSLCRGTMRVLAGLDLLSRLEPVNFRTLNLAEYNRRHGLQLIAETLEAEMVAVSGGKAEAGFTAYRTLAHVLPLGWLLVPLLWLPGVSAIGNWVYRIVAQNRPRALACDALCRVPASDEAARGVAGQPGWVGGWQPILGISALLAFLLTCWYARFEHFPFTGMQMYADGPWVPGKEPMTYYKVFAVRENGQHSKAYFDQVMGIMAFNGRYRPLLKKCFEGSSGIESCRHVLLANGAAYNRKARLGERVTQFEVQQWASPLSNPNAGSLVNRFVMDIPSNKDGN